MNDLDRHTERLCSSCLSISPAHAPLPEGAAHKPLLGGGASSEKYAITQLITSGKRLVPLLSWVTYFTKKKKRVFFHEKHMNYFIVLVAVKRGGVGEIENAKCKTNLIFLR